MDITATIVTIIFLTIALATGWAMGYTWRAGTGPELGD